MSGHLRAAHPDEFAELQSGSEWFRVFEESGQVTGHVACSQFNGLPFIHELKSWSEDPTVATQLCLAARNKIRELGFEEMFCNIDPKQPAMFKPLTKHGFEVVQVIMRSAIKKVNE